MTLVKVLGLIDPVLEMVDGNRQDCQRGGEIVVDFDFIDVVTNEFVDGEENV